MAALRSPHWFHHVHAEWPGELAVHCSPGPARFQALKADGCTAIVTLMNPRAKREAGLIEALRGMRMLNHAAWLAERWEDPAFPLAFPWFGEPRYWERHIAELREQLEAVEDPPLLRTQG